MQTIMRCTVAFVLALAAASISAAEADLITVSTHVSQLTANRGGTNSGEILITNNATTDVRVKLTARVVYSDGTVQVLSDIGDPGTLAPGGGYVVNIFFLIPPDAALGMADFVAEASASSGSLTEKETSSASFLVAP